MKFYIDRDGKGFPRLFWAGGAGIGAATVAVSTPLATTITKQEQQAQEDKIVHKKALDTIMEHTLVEIDAESFAADLAEEENDELKKENRQLKTENNVLRRRLQALLEEYTRSKQ